MIQKIKTRVLDCKTFNPLDKSEEVNKYIGSRIRLIRQSKKFTQKDLWSRLNKKISQQQLSRYEKALSPIPAYVIFDISRILNVSVEAFMPPNYEPQVEMLLDNNTLDRALDAAINSFLKVSNIDNKEVQQLEKLLLNLYKK